MSYEDAFEALGDKTRKALFDRLGEGPQTVGALAAGLPVSRPAISQHLKILKDAGLVAVQADGTRHLYRLEISRLMALKDHLEGVCSGLKAAHDAEIARQLEERRYG
jgi:DNA-binding transcriptional ArsR family regulator